MRAGLGSSPAPRRPDDRNEKQSGRRELGGYLLVSNNNLPQMCQSLTPETAACAYVNVDSISDREYGTWIPQHLFVG